MNEKTYEVPALVEVGDFSQLTQMTCCGKWADSIWGYYFD
ncbi:lasso RiPP family leader peptide-containing protein [Streptosporangium sp. NPDC048865]